ncbi:LOW QUALITY PROTEIN: ankyrin repeat domain-containing protein 26 [Mus caroli]|uniref:LOW QUALITY PROTEIN: ankyrin repeat domain-containing protein 26 n=1 Tax=Mus caroli TaxID=10089 RepID=A0A6P5NZG9_MUSCR|nr:LOW QUALITY PROTEIN: ankyrin repeat domain-containing protein 26 [Mus caroli]
MESLRLERQQSPQKLDVTHTGICSWIETEAKTWNELRGSLAMLKAAKKMRCRIQRIELENSNLVVTIEKQAREMEALGEKLLNAGISVVESAPGGEPGETREDVAASWSQMELMELTSELAKARMQNDSCKMEVQKYKELYLKELRSNNALLSRLQNRTCKCPEWSCSNHGEKMRWKTSSMVALVGPHPECPQVPYLTSSTMEPQGNVPQPSQCPEARCEFMENPRSWSEDKEKGWLELISSIRFLHGALHRETRRTKELQKELAEMKKIFNMPPQEGRGHKGRRHSCPEVSKVSQAEMGVPVAMLRLEGEATTADNLVCIHETPTASFLTQMELEMKSIKSAIAEVNTQECLVRKELEVIEQLYRGELERIDSVRIDSASAFGSECANGERGRAQREPGPSYKSTVSGNPAHDSWRLRK